MTNQYNQDVNSQCTPRQVNRLKWILADYFMEENKIERTKENKKLFEIRLYASVKNLHNVVEKQRPTVKVVQKYFDSYGMVKNADGIWERTSKTKLPKELTSLVQIDEPEKAPKKAPKKAPAKKSATISARKKAPADKKLVKIVGKNMTDDQRADAIALLQERIDALLEA
tara:strand:- start:170 stop:679 length:510 start_codon:yes stop_codon:yes gene_type:complete